MGCSHPGSHSSRKISSLAAGALVTLELPLYSGPCYLYFQTSSGLADMTFTIQDSANPNSVGLGSKILQFISSGTGLGAAQIMLPRYQCRVQMKNNNAAVQTCNFTLHAIEQAA